MKRYTSYTARESICTPRPSSGNNEFAWVYTCRGYTLIELLLVIAVLGILSSVAALTYRTLHTNARLDRTALEMQNFLEGAMAYKIDNSTWPPQNADLGTCSTDITQLTNSDFVRKYVPNQTTLSQLGYYYCWNQGPISSGTSSALFWVALKIPHGDINMAQQLAARLPNGVATSEPTSNTTPAACTTNADCYVRATVATPSSNSGGGTVIGTTIAGSGDCMDSDGSGTQNTPGVPSSTVSCMHTNTANTNNPDSYRVTFPCATNTTANIIVNPNHFYQINPGLGTAQDYPLVELHTNNVACTSGTTATCTFQVTAKYVQNNKTYYISKIYGSVGASYVAMCIPN